MKKSIVNNAQAREELFNHVNSSVLLLDRQSRIVFMNPAAERLLSISLKMAQQTPLKELVRPSQRLTKSVKEVLKSGRTIKIHELEIFSARTSKKLQVELAPLGNQEKPTGVLLWINELSVTQALQEELRLMDRISMMGTIASGLAHEIRNPLGGIRAAAQMLSRESDEKEKEEYTAMILSEVDRINELVTELLDFSRPRKKKMTSVNVNKVLSELCELNRDIMKTSKIECKQEFDPSLPPVYGEEASLKQAFLNLIKNGIEAMEEGGTLLIGTSFHSHSHALLGEGQTGAIAEIAIQDTGPGIPEKNFKSLFTPFFTTKPQGTGLGLMITQRILKEHQGTVTVESQTEKGTTFRIFLKLATQTNRD